jgi:hypothetical protein
VVEWVTGSTETAMKFRIPHVVAAVLAAGALPVAFAQSPQKADFGPLPPGTAAQELVAEPTASTARTTGPDGELANEIAQELISEPSLKGAKITVVPDEGTITLVGVARTKAQAAKAAEIATARAGQGKVINAIQVEEV